MIAGLFALGAVGCSSMVYRPLSGLHRPVAINIDYANFADLSLTITCLPGPALSATESQTLCRKLQQLFENQGAEVFTKTSQGRQDDALDGPGETKVPKRETALELVLSARIVQQKEGSFLFWTWITDYTLAQDIVIRDASGFLLIKDTLTGRFSRRLKFTDETEAFSPDFYGQLSQLAFNAKMRRQVLRESWPTAREAN